MKKLTLAALLAMKPGDALPDPQVRGPGYALRYRRKQGGIYPEFMWKVGGKWLSKSLPPLPAGAELEDMKEAWIKARYDQAYAETGDQAWAIAQAGQPAPGDVLAIRLSPARNQANERRREAKAGQDPRGGGITLRGALELHLASKVRSPRTEQEYRDKPRLHLPDWLDRPLASISRQMVRERHRLITAGSGAYAANGTMRVFSACWNRARRQHPELPECPTVNVDWHKERPRRNAIKRELLPQWWREIGQTPPVRRDFYRLALFTGLRRQTLTTIRREHIDLEARTLFIPKPKGGEDRAFTLPLSSYLVELIGARLEANDADCPWLFPAESKEGHIVEPMLRNNGGVPFTIHSLRATYMSAATAAGVHPYHLKLLVNHALPQADVTAGYLREDEVDALREPQQKVTDWLLAAVEPAPAREAGASAAVLPLRAALAS
jgi:integrase